MEFVKLNGTYRGMLYTTDQSSFPETAAWPDDDIEAAELTATVDGASYGGTKTVTKQSEIGLHVITLDCSGVASGSIINLSGEYYIDLIRYYWQTQIFVDPSVAIQEVAEADQRFILDSGVYKLAVYRKGTATELLTRKNIKQLNGSNMTDPSTQILGGFQQ